MTETTVSAYEEIGGAGTVRAAVDELYKSLLADDQVAGYFDGVDLSKVKRHMVEVLSQVLGGPAVYDMALLGAAHRHVTRQGLTGPEPITVHVYRRVCIHAAGTLYGLKVPMDIIMDVGQALASLENVIVGPVAE